VLRTLSTKCHNYSERSLRSWWIWHGPRWNLLNHVTKNGNRGHMTLYAVYAVYGLYARTIYITRTSRTKGILRSQELYLRTVSPYLDSSLFVVNLRIQLKLICWALTPRSILPETCVVYIT